MDNKEKVYTPTVIDDMAFPQDPGMDLDTSQSSSGSSNQKTYSSESIKDNTFPTKKVAVELLSTSLNTKSKKILQKFEFTESGAIQIGKYQDGISGEIKISPNGIVAKDQLGNTTISIDGQSGDATFSGVLRAQSTIAGSVIVGNSDIIIDGENRRMIFFEEDRAAIIIGEL